MSQSIDATCLPTQLDIPHPPGNAGSTKSKGIDTHDDQHHQLHHRNNKPDAVNVSPAAPKPTSKGKDTRSSATSSSTILDENSPDETHDNSSSPTREKSPFFAVLNQLVEAHWRDLEKSRTDSLQNVSTAHAEKIRHQLRANRLDEELRILREESQIEIKALKNQIELYEAKLKRMYQRLPGKDNGNNNNNQANFFSSYLVSVEITYSKSNQHQQDRDEEDLEFTDTDLIINRLSRENERLSRKLHEVTRQRDIEVSSYRASQHDLERENSQLRSEHQNLQMKYLELLGKSTESSLVSRHSVSGGRGHGIQQQQNNKQLGGKGAGSVALGSRAALVEVVEPNFVVRGEGSSARRPLEDEDDEGTKSQKRQKVNAAGVAATASPHSRTSKKIKRSNANNVNPPAKVLTPKKGKEPSTTKKSNPTLIGGNKHTEPSNSASPRGRGGHQNNNSNSNKQSSNQNADGGAKMKSTRGDHHESSGRFGSSERERERERGVGDRGGR
ncbi:hypothetical protein HDU76_012816 [Blyttiomyces sp. JEL0837]|nr:hypothetical protein HDU76_012816 [Blyttiomyces sp. JEL0837]